jgi:hypothetical protein
MECPASVPNLPQQATSVIVNATGIETKKVTPILIYEVSSFERFLYQLKTQFLFSF